MLFAYSGNCDPRNPYHLTDKGRQQALALGESLRHEGIELIISSAFLRGRQTAWLANQVLGLPIVVNSLANENRVGSALEGRINAEFQNMIRDEPANTGAPDGESFVDMKARIHRLMLELQRGSPRTVLLSINRRDRMQRHKSHCLFAFQQRSQGSRSGCH